MRKKILDFIFSRIRKNKILMTECGREKSGRNKYFFNDDKVEMQEKEKRERNRRRREGEEIGKD